MKRMLIAVAEAGLLLTFATGAMAALFDPSAASLAMQGFAVSALVVLGALRVALHRRSEAAQVPTRR